MTEIKTVGELIKKLQEFDPDFLFKIHIDVPGQNVYTDSINDISLSWEGIKGIDIWGEE
jgi:hypothetical protein